jgi:hypothetical protein
MYFIEFPWVRHKVQADPQLSSFVPIRRNGGKRPPLPEENLKKSAIA